MKLPRLPKTEFKDMQYQPRAVGNQYTPEQMRAYAAKAHLQCQMLMRDRAALIAENEWSTVEEREHGHELAQVIRDMPIFVEKP